MIRRVKVWLTAVLLCGLSADLAWSADAADDAYKIAAGHYARQRWQLAAESFQSFLETYPAHSQTAAARFFLAESQLQSGDLTQARDLFRRILQEAPSTTYSRQAMFRAGETSYLLGESAVAREELEKYLAQYPQDALNSYVLTYLGEMALNAGDPAQAATWFEQSITRFPEGRLIDDCRLGLCRARQKLGELDVAAHLATDLAAKQSSALADDAQLELAAIDYARADYARATAGFEQFIKQYPDSDLVNRARLSLGWCMFQRRQFDQAATEFKQLVTDKDIGFEARYWLGLVQKAQERWILAADTLLSALAERPPESLAAPIQFHAADSLLRGGQAKQARDEFQRLLASAPDGPWADDCLAGQMQAALALADHELVSRLAAEFNQRHASSELSGQVRRIEARSRLATKDFSGARQLLAQIPGTPDGADAALDSYLLALAMQGEGRNEEALATIESAGRSGMKLDAEMELVQAAALIALSRFEEAIKPLERYRQAAPKGPGIAQCHAELAICLAHVGDFMAARHEFDALRQLNADPALVSATASHVAQTAYGAGEREWARELFELLASDGATPNDRAAGLSGIAWCQLSSNELADAQASFAELIDRFPDSSQASEATLARARILEKLSQPESAVEMYERVIEQGGEGDQVSQAVLQLARLYDRLQRDEQASQQFERLVRDYPDLPEIDAVLYEWAWVLCDLKRLDEADELFLRLRSEHPQSRYWSDASFRLAEHAYQDRELDRAVALTDELLERESLPSTLRPHALYLRGQIAAAQSEWTKVSECMQRLLADYPQAQMAPQAEYWSAEAMYRLARYDEAAQRFEQLAEQTKGQTEPWLAMVALRKAQVYAAQKRWEECQQTAQQIAARFPDFEQQYEADYTLGRALAAQARFDEARQAYQRAIHARLGEKTETAAMAQLMIGESHFHQKQYETALREYLTVEILYAYPELQAAALLQAGKCYELLNDWKQAAEVYARLLHNHADTSYAQEAASRHQTATERLKSPR